MAESGQIISHIKHPCCLPHQAETAMLGFELGSLIFIFCFFVWGCFFLHPICRLGLGLGVGWSCMGWVRASSGCKKQPDRARAKVHLANGRCFRGR